MMNVLDMSGVNDEFIYAKELNNSWSAKESLEIREWIEISEELENYFL